MAMSMRAEDPSTRCVLIEDPPSKFHQISGGLDTDIWAQDWAQKCALAEEYNDWVEGCYGGRHLRFKIDSMTTEWSVGSMIVPEKNFRRRTGYPPAWDSTGVFNCTRIDDGEGAREAVLKIYMQIPHVDANYGETEPAATTPDHVKGEVIALRRLTKAIPPRPGPRLLAYRRIIQNGKRWVPGGYTRLLLMEKLPGKALDPDEYWSWTQETRDKICSAFRSSMERLLELRIQHYDPALRNLLWDEETENCYFVDFEGSLPFAETDHLPFHETYYERWGLKDKKARS